MSKKIPIIVILTVVLSVFSQTFAFAISNEMKAVATKFVEIIIWVAISSIVIAIGAFIYKKIKNPKIINNKTLKQEFKCELDDTQTIDEAIDVFLKINKY